MILAGTQSKQSGAARALQRIYLKNPRWGSTTDFSSELCANIARQSLRKTLVPVLNVLLILLTCDYLSSFQPTFLLRRGLMATTPLPVALKVQPLRHGYPYRSCKHVA